jgi:hypothetical protein
LGLQPVLPLAELELPLLLYERLLPHPVVKLSQGKHQRLRKAEIGQA